MKNIYDPPVGAKRNPCFPIRTELVHEGDLVVIGYHVCRVYKRERNDGRGWVLHVVRDPRYPGHETFNETRFTIYEKFTNFVWMYDLRNDLPL